MLPEPDGRPPVTEYTQLCQEVRSHYTLGKPMPGRVPFPKRIERLAGRWPEFALAVQDDLAQSKFVIPTACDFGPARPAEFRPALRQVIEKDLLPRLSPRARFALVAFEGRWPDYPRLLIALARQHDVGLPGTMLPGKPSDWDRTYGGVRRPALRPKGQE
jgi:hypothetical protein